MFELEDTNNLSIYMKPASKSKYWAGDVSYTKTGYYKDYTNYYKDELIKLGYKKVKHNGNELYVQNNLNDSSFQYIYIGDLQISYGVCTSGYYEDILK